MMRGSFFDHPDCRIPVVDWPAPRSLAELEAAALRLPSGAALRISRAEFRAISHLVGLGYRFAGRRIEIA